MPINELFKKLFESELLTEETKAELQTQVETFITEAVETAKKEAEEKIRVELTEKFVADKEALIEALDTKADEYLAKEIAELKEDIEKFRDLEVEFAEKLQEEKKQMAETVKKDMGTLVETLDSFLEERLTAEFTELKEDIAEVKKDQFGRRIFEAYQTEFLKKHVNENETAVALTKSTDELKNTRKMLETVQKELSASKRDQKLIAVLEALQGRPREVMAAILANVPTEKLDETYKTYIGRVLHESVSTTSSVDDSTTTEKEDGSNPEVLAEGKEVSTGSEAATKVVTGDTPVLESEKTQDKEVSRLNESDKERLRKLSGIIL